MSMRSRPEPFNNSAAAAPIESAVAEIAVDPYTAASERLTARLVASAEMQQLYPTASLADAPAIGYNLANKGLRRLDDDRLIQRAALMARIYAEADTPTCAAIFVGDRAPGMEAALRRLSAAEIDQWFELVYGAMSAELRQTGQPENPSPKAVRRSVQELLASLAPADAELVFSMLQSPREGSPEDACRAGRLIHAEVARLPEPSKATLARALVWP
jgi:hypothetical protein